MAALARADAGLRAFVDFDSGAAFGTGPLAGVRVGIKSNIAVRGLPWTAGMGTRRDVIAAEDAPVTARLRAAGAAILGTLNMHEAALGATTDNPFFGRTMNPHRAGFTPGGSSGGSGAAVAAGLVDLALGTDTLGSVRIPAAYCGVYGLKPTNGLLPAGGFHQLNPTLDCIGPLARSMAMLARGFEILAPEAPPERPALVRLLCLEGHGGVSVEPAVEASFKAALGALGLPVSMLRLPAPPGEIRRAALAETGRLLAAGVAGAPAGEVSPQLAQLLGALQGLPTAPTLLAETRAALVGALGADAVLLMPTAPQAAFAHGARPPASQADFTGLGNVAGLPALAVPSGFDAQGLPVSVQLVAPAGRDRALLALGTLLDSRLSAFRPPSSLVEGA